MIDLNNIPEIQKVKHFLNAYTEAFYIDKALFTLSEQHIIKKEQISDIIIALISEGFLVKDQYSGSKYYTAQTYKLRYSFSSSYADDICDSIGLDQKRFGFFLELIANAYERSHANIKYLLRGAEYIQLKSLNIFYSDLQRKSEDELQKKYFKFRLFDNNHIPLNTKRYVLGFPVIKSSYVNDNTGDDFDYEDNTCLIPVFYLQLENVETVLGEPNTYTACVNGSTVPFINNYFIDNIVYIFSDRKYSHNGSVYTVLERFLSDFNNTVNSSATPIVDAIKLFKHYFYNFFAFHNDFDFKNLSTIDVYKNSQSVIFNSCLLGQLKNDFNSLCAKEIRDIADLAKNGIMPKSSLDSFYNLKADSLQSEKTDIKDPWLSEKNCCFFNLDDNQELDKYQSQAVKSFLTNKITLLQGPPGTGKTYTIATAAMNCMLRGEKCLISSYNHTAISAFNERAYIVESDRKTSFSKVLKSKDNNLEQNLSSFVKKEFSSEVQSSDKVFNCFKKIKTDLESKASTLSLIFAKTLHLYHKDIPERVLALNNDIILIKPYISKNSKLKALFNSLKDDLLKDEGNYGLVFDIDKFLKLEQSTIDRLSKSINSASYKITSRSDFFRHLILNLNQEHHWFFYKTLSKCVQSLNDIFSSCSELIDLLKRLKQLDHRFIEEVKNKDTALFFLNRITQLKKISINERDVVTDFLCCNPRKTVSSGLYDDLYSIKHGFKPDDLIDNKADEIFRHFPVVSTSILSVGKSIPLKPEFFDLVVIDEASQFDFVPLIPLLFRAKRVAVVGDPKQLSPINTADKQLVKLLLHRDCDTHLLDYINLFNFSASAYDYIENYVVKSENLRKLKLLNNRRSEPKITQYISHYFYNKELLPAYIERQDNTGYLIGDEIKGMHFIDVPLNEGIKQDSHRFENEARAVIDLLKRIFKSNSGYKGSVGVITPYRSQAELIGSLIFNDSVLSHLDQDVLKVSTVHSFQSQERDSIILSLCLNNDNKFVSDPRLINVAISRARDYVFVVGNKKEALNSSRSYVRALVSAADQNAKNRRNLEDLDIDDLIETQTFETYEEALLFRSLQLELDKRGYDGKYTLTAKLKVMTGRKDYIVDIALIDKELRSARNRGDTYISLIGLAIECNGSQHYINGGESLIDDGVIRSNDIKYSNTPLEIIEFRNSHIRSNIQLCVNTIIEKYMELTEDV